MTPEQIKLLEMNKIIPPNCPKAQVDFFATVCEKKKLDPFLRQIHLVERNERDGKGGWKKSYTIQSGIDGMRVIAQRNCKVRSYRRWVEKREDDMYGCCEIDTEDRGKYYDELPYEEYVQRTKEGVPNSFWNKFKQTMIKKCAEESVLRMMAPEDLSGVYGDDEMLQADTEEHKLLPEQKEKDEQEPKNKEAQELFKPPLNEGIVKSIQEAKTTDELSEIYNNIPEDQKTNYIDKLSTRKAILNASQKGKK